MKERRGKRKLYYEDGKKTNCDYNRYNDYFILLCLKYLKRLTIDNISDFIEFFRIVISFILVLVLIMAAPISIPILVILEKDKLYKLHGSKISYKNEN
jgi:hypothetical protein